MSPSSNTPPSPLRFVGRRIAHHGAHSGYDRLVHYLPEGELLEPPSGRLRRRILWTLYYRLLASRTPIAYYGGDEFCVEAAALSRRMRCPRALYHFLYGDSQLYWTARMRSHRNVVVATFHNPPGVHRALLRDDRHLRGLDAVVAVGRSQLPLLRERVGAARVHHVPHGVDVDFFAPATEEPLPAEPHVLLVGHYLRDFVCAKEVLAALVRDGVRATVVCEAGRARDLAGTGAALRAGLNDSALRSLYRQATACLLPLHAATANNALLEGLACGTPLVASDVGDVREYAGDAALLVPRGDARAHLEATRRLIDDADLRARLAVRARARALRFDWRRVAARMRALYASLFG
ncbi:MAG: glycosyltransferase [Planctomycetota bacterium]|nr:MAG: glycosyltransferase [Planctomycetota bacterium]